MNLLNLDLNKEEKLFFNDLLNRLNYDFEPDFKFKIPYSFFKNIIRLNAPIEVFKQYIPSINEKDSQFQKDGLIDPIGDKIHFKTNQLIHRYKSKVLFLPTNQCPINCRFCFRRNELHDLDNNNKIFKADFNKSITYLKNNSEISEIIFSGGDPLILNENSLSFYFEEFSKIDSIKYIRFHSRVPIFLNIQELEAKLKILEKFKNRFHFTLIIHVNHFFEVDNFLSLEKIKRLEMKFNQVLSQSVLLKDINDSEIQLIKLFQSLSNNGIKPYYLHHPDQVKGGMHFYLSKEVGKDLIKKVSNQLPGWMIPKYILDNPEGTGKVQIGH